MAAILKRNDLLSTITPRSFMSLLAPARPSCNGGAARGFRFPTYEITLMAHGECKDDITKHFSGWVDTPLSPFGVEQAKRAGKIMAMDDSHFHVAYTSEMERAQETARQALAPLATQPKVFATWRLNDRHLGDLSGYNRSQMALVHGERKVREWLEDYHTLPPIIKMENPRYRHIMQTMNKKHLSIEQIPRAESVAMVYNRVLPYWENIIVPSLKMRNRVIVIAHETALCALIRRFAELSDAEALHVAIPPAIPFTFTLDNHMRIIRGKGVKHSNKTRAQYIPAAAAATQQAPAPSAPPAPSTPGEPHWVPQTTRRMDDLKSRH